MANCKQNFLILSLCVSAFLFIPIRINTIEKDFEKYLATFNKTYNATEYKRRLEIYKKSIDIIKKYNTGRNDNLSALYGVTEFTDLIPDTVLLELFHPKFIYPKHQKPIVWTSAAGIPMKVDWRDKGVISDVYNQRTCGACYAFTAIENIESMSAIKFGKLEKYSIQQMIDCSVVNNGCDGGDTCVLLEWLKYNNVSILKEEDYPLRLVTEECKANSIAKSTVHIKSYKCENLVNNEEKILQYLANVGPVIAAVNAAPWHYYIEGIIRYHCDGAVKFLNHAVQIVGYDMSERIPYYIVRNSWGKSFGADGYIKIAIGQNTCGIANKVVTISL